MTDGMTTAQAAQRWRETWERAWATADVDSIAALYAPAAPYRSGPFRAPEVDSARGYVTRTFAGETDVRCRFGDPIVTGRRAAVEWWAMLDEGEGPVTLAGVTILTFDDNGLVVDHMDHFGLAEGTLQPPTGWGEAR